MGKGLTIGRVFILPEPTRPMTTHQGFQVFVHRCRREADLGGITLKHLEKAHTRSDHQLRSFLALASMHLIKPRMESCPRAQNLTAERGLVVLIAPPRNVTSSDSANNSIVRLPGLQDEVAGPFVVSMGMRIFHSATSSTGASLKLSPVAVRLQTFNSDAR
jgi:hypothetical protein